MRIATIIAEFIWCLTLQNLFEGYLLFVMVLITGCVMWIVDLTYMKVLKWI